MAILLRTMAMQEKTKPSSKRILSAADRAYSGIIDLVLQHELRPGERTSVNLLAKRLTLGRTPIKEAITRLQTEGLLSVTGRSGTMVNLITRKETEQLFALRRALEEFAADEVVKNITSNQLRQLRKWTQELRRHSVNPRNYMQSTSKFVRANVEFHAIIIEATGNRFLSRLYSQIQINLQIVTYLVRRHYDPEAGEQRQREQMALKRQREHEAILSAITARNAKLLRAALAAHAQTTEDAILATLKEKTRTQSSFKLKNGATSQAVL